MKSLKNRKFICKILSGLFALRTAFEICELENKQHFLKKGLIFLKLCCKISPLNKFVIILLIKLKSVAI